MLLCGLCCRLSGFSLFLVGEMYNTCVHQQAKKMGLLSTVMKKIFPFTDDKYEFNLTHILLFTMLVVILSMMHHPAQDVIEQDAEKTKKKEKKRAAKAEAEAKAK